MYKGQRIETFIKNPDNIDNDNKQKFVQIIISISIDDYNNDIFNNLEKTFEINRNLYYEEYRTESDKEEKSLNINYIGSIDFSLDLSRDTILSFFSDQKFSGKLYVSDISSILIPNIYPFWKTSIKTSEEDKLIPIASNKFFTRILNDLIVESGAGHAIFKYFSRWCFSNGMFSLGKKYKLKCLEKEIDPINITNEINKEIIKSIFWVDYSCIINDIIQYEEKKIFKVIVKDHFFLFKPSLDNRIDVHNFLLTDVANVFFRNCPLMRDVITGFFESVFFSKDYENNVSPDRELINFMGFEFDYVKNENCIFDFSKSGWLNVDEKKKINLPKCKELTAKHELERVELCKSVNNLKRYKMRVDKSTKETIPWDKNVETNNFVEFNYIEWSVFNKDVIKNFFDITNISTDIYKFQGKINKLFIDFFITEKMEDVKNSDVIKKVDIDYSEECTFLIYHKSFIDMSSFLKL
jgi:hypothetical protein